MWQPGRAVIGWRSNPIPGYLAAGAGGLPEATHVRQIWKAGRHKPR